MPLPIPYNTSMQCSIIDLGLTDYKRAYAFQKECVEELKSKRSGGFLIFTEHKPVFTLGRFAKRDNLLINEELARAGGIDIIKTDRGGDVTFHGPGQAVTYPIFNLTEIYRDVHRFLRDLEEAVILTMSEFKIASFRFKGRPGVWTDAGKISSVGIGISRWITYHGIAVNANVDLGYFKMIYPCGFKDIRVTSMKEILKKEVGSRLLKSRLSENFRRVFNLDITNSLPANPKKR